MKQRNEIVKEGIDVNKRFAIALDALKNSGTIRGIKTFTRKYNINYGNFYVTLKYPEEHNIKSEQLVYLVRDYGINASWLLLGEGSMFN